jgi:ribosome-binding protein aMBF1 (putative translation factor)
MTEVEIATWYEVTGKYLAPAQVAAALRSGSYRIEVPDSLGKRIADARAARGMTCAQLAEAVEVTRAQVYRWEAGTTTPAYETLSKIAKALKTTQGKLLPT